MGNYNSVQSKAKKKISNHINRQIKEDSKKCRKVECKILLCGSSEGGKSTILKQLKIIYGNGYTEDELANCRTIVYKSLIDSAQSIVKAMTKLGISPIEPSNRGHLDMILDYQISPDPNFILDPEVANAIHQLWLDPIIPQIMNHGYEFHLMDSAIYFLSEVRRISDPSYLPNEPDLLRAYKKYQESAEISEIRFNVGQLSIHLFEVGRDQRSERKIWIQCFESVTSIVFCAALSEYDQVLSETNQNQMTESLALFEKVVNSRWSPRTPIILLLTKIDVFKNKLPKVPLENYFPEYIGGSDINKAVRYILWKFMQRNKAGLSIYPHLTQAMDTSNIRLVFAAVKETIFQNAIKDLGIL